MKPLIVGLMPSGNVCRVPMGGEIGWRLMDWAGLHCEDTGDAIRCCFDTINLNLIYKDKFDDEEAFSQSERLRLVSYGQPHILCGREVASFFGMKNNKFWQWKGNYVVIPHPSGKCRIYNQQSSRDKTGRILREALKKAGQVRTSVL